MRICEVVCNLRNKVTYSYLDIKGDIKYEIKYKTKKTFQLWEKFASMLISMTTTES